MPIAQEGRRLKTRSDDGHIGGQNRLHYVQQTLEKGVPSLSLCYPNAVSLNCCSSPDKEVSELGSVATVRLRVQRKNDAPAGIQIRILNTVQEELPLFLTPTLLAAMTV